MTRLDEKAAKSGRAGGAEAHHRARPLGHVCQWGRGGGHNRYLATGYRDNSAWVKLPEVKDAHGNFVQQQGVGPVPNFYFIGRPWQRLRGSALIMGVGDDAAWMTDRILTDFGGQEQPERNALLRA